MILSSGVSSLYVGIPGLIMVSTCFLCPTAHPWALLHRWLKVQPSIPLKQLLNVTQKLWGNKEKQKCEIKLQFIVIGWESRYFNFIFKWKDVYGCSKYSRSESCRKNTYTKFLYQLIFYSYLAKINQCNKF